MDKLENLVRIGQLKVEPPDQAEIDGMLRSAMHRLQDAGFEQLPMIAAFHWPMAQHTHWRFQRCDGMATGLKTVIWFSNAWNRQSA